MYNKLPESNRLELSQTFHQQRNLVNDIIVPTIMENINTNIFPITGNVIYEMIHALHRHRREEFLKKDKSPAYNKEQDKRKHLNARRYDVSFFKYYY